MKKFSIKKYFDDRQPKNARFLTIAIDGRGGSGKTVLTEYIKILLPDFVFLNFDDYFEPRDRLAEWGYLNKLRFTRDVIKPLQKTNTFIYRPYDWHKEPHVTERTIQIKDGMCLEGCFSFDFMDWDLKIWVDTPKEVCLKRGLAREHMPRERVLRVWRDIWQPQENRYIARVKPFQIADIIVDGTKPFEDQMV